MPKTDTTETALDQPQNPLQVSEDVAEAVAETVTGTVFNHAEIPLCDLRFSKRNVRRNKVDNSRIRTLADSIAQHGLIQNLTVRPIPTDDTDNQADDATAIYEVTAGATRLRALKMLLNAKRITACFPVPCQIRTESTNADNIHISLDENLHRTAMHPMDQVDAFKAMANQGEDIATIATRTGLSESTVRQRIALSSVHPNIRAACRKNEIPLSMVKAYALCSDPKHQLAIHNDVKPHNAYAIREHIKESAYDESSAAFSFIGHDAYEAAGGDYVADLFTTSGRWRTEMTDDLDAEAPEGNPRRISHPEILQELVVAKLTAQATILAETWKWATHSLQPVHEYNLPDGMTALPPVPSAAQRASIAKSRAKVDAHQLLMNNAQQKGDYDALHKLRNKHWDLERKHADTRRRALAKATHTKEQHAVAGCIVAFQNSGVEVHKGLVRKEDRALIRQLPEHMRPERPISQRSQSTRTDSTHPYSARHARELSATRAGIVRRHLPENPDAAFDLAAYQICRAALQDHRHTRHAPHIRMTIEPMSHENDGAPDLTAIPEEHLAWTRTGSHPKAFRLFSELPETIKKTLLATAIGICVPPNLGCDDPDNSLEVLIDRMDIDFRSEFRPTAENYWNYLTKPRCIAIATEVLGEKWVSDKDLQKMKKAPLAHFLEVTFADNDQAPPEARAWSVPEFQPANS